MSIENPTSVSEKVTQLLDDLRDSRPNHWSRWLQIAGGREALEASLLAQVETQGLSAEDIYIHWFNTNMEILPYLTSREGIMRGRIEEDIRDIMVDYGFEIRDGQFVDEYVGDASADAKVRDEFLAWTQGLNPAQLIDAFFEIARVKGGIEDPRELYITGVGEPWNVLNEEDVERRVDEIDRELGEPDPRVLKMIRDLADEPVADLAEELTGAIYGAHNVIPALARALELDAAIVKRDLPDLSREECSFTFQTSRDGDTDAVELNVRSGVASNPYLEKVLRLHKDKGRKGVRVVARPLEREGLPEA